MDKWHFPMIQFSYKSETVGNLVKNPEDRSVAVKNLIEKLGGNYLHSIIHMVIMTGFLTSSIHA